MPIQPSTLTAQEIVDIQNHYGLTSSTTNNIINDLVNGTIPEGFSADDLLAYLAISGVDWSLVFDETALADPDASSVAYLFEDEAVQTMTQELVSDNPDDVNVSDWKAYLEAASAAVPSTDAINQALQILAENEANQATSGDGEETYEITDAMLEDLYEMAVPMGPIAMSMVSAFQASSWAGEMAEEMGEKFEDLSVEMESILDDLEDIDYDSSDSAALAEAQAQGQILNTKLGMMQTTFKILQDTDETIKKIAASSEENFASQVDSQRRLNEFILNKM
jgi:hypothetical protein